MKIRYLQFSIRSLLLLTAGVAVLLSMWTVYIGPFQLQRQAMEAIEKTGGQYKTRPGGPAWLRQLAGSERFQEVVHAEMADGLDEHCLDLLVRLPRLETLVIGSKKFGDEQLRRLARLPSLRTLLLDRTGVSGSAVRQLQTRRPELGVTLGITFDDLRFKKAGQRIQPVVLRGKSSLHWEPGERAAQLVGQRVRVSGIVGAVLGKAMPRTTRFRLAWHDVR